MTDDVVERLDRITAILRLAHRDAIEHTRIEIRSDKVNAAILDATAQWAGTASLQATVMKKSGAKERTVQMRIVDLLAQGLIEKRGGGRNIEYRATGLI
jgi:hypothetical protein